MQKEKKEDLLRRVREHKLVLRLEELPWEILFTLCQINKVKYKVNDTKIIMAMNLCNRCLNEGDMDAAPPRRRCLSLQVTQRRAARWSRRRS